MLPYLLNLLKVLFYQHFYVFMVYTCIVTQAFLGFLLFCLGAKNLTEISSRGIEKNVYLAVFATGGVSCLIIPVACRYMFTRGTRPLVRLSVYLGILVVLHIAILTFWCLHRSGHETEMDRKDVLYFSSLSKEKLNYYQAKFGCCGVYGSHEYGDDIPFSCCPSHPHDLRSFTHLKHITFEKCIENEKFYTQGCARMRMEQTKILGMAIFQVLVASILTKVICILSIWWIIKNKDLQIPSPRSSPVTSIAPI